MAGGTSANPAPSPAPTVTASAPAPARSPASTAAAVRVRRGLVDCDQAAFYSWPAFDTAPSPASYPPARMGDAINVIGDAQTSLDGKLLYETTIDVVHPWGNGVHYWIAKRCVNAG